MASAGPKDDESAESQISSSPKQVTILVGSREARFALPRDSLETSRFFHAIFNKDSDWKERTTNKVHLPEIAHETFWVYFHWLCTGDVGLVRTAKLMNGRPEFDEETSIDHFDTIVMRLSRLYALGSMLLDTAFCNAIVDDLADLTRKTSTFPGIGSINLLYELVPSRSMLTRYVVDVWCAYSTPEQFREALGDLPAEFVAEMAAVAVEESKVRRNEFKYPEDREGCYYHEHEEGDQCGSP